MKNNKIILFLFCLILFSLSSCYATSDNTDIISSYDTDDLSTQNNINTNIKNNDKYIFIDEDPTYPEIDIGKYDTIYEEDENIETNNIEKSQNSIQNLNNLQKTVYVDEKNGNDDNDGNELTPYKTLQKAVVSIGNNSIINVKNGEYILDKEIIINKSLVINGENNQNTIINCNNHLGLNLSSTTLVLNNLKFINGYNKSIINSDFKVNPGVMFGGGHVTLLINECIFTNNSGKIGSVIFSTGKESKINITNSQFYNNQAKLRAGVLHIGGENSIAYITNCSFKNNKVNTTDVIGNYGCGGAIYLGAISNLTLLNCNFSNNSAVNGSCIYTAHSAFINISNSNFNNNMANNKDAPNNASRGGAITLGSGKGVITNTTFINNTATFAGAISINSGNITDIADCTFINNYASNHGGSIHSFGKTTIKNSIFKNNSAVRRGGAIIGVGVGDEITIENCQFINNHLNKTYFNGKEYSLGGALSANGQSSNWTVKNNLFINNSAAYGGVIYVTTDVDYTDFVNNTYTDNSAISGGAFMFNTSDLGIRINNDVFNHNIAKVGGAIYFNESHLTVTIHDTIFTNNIAENGGAIFIPKYEHLSIVNVTFTENTAKEKGGALFINNSTYLRIFESILTKNKATTGSAIYYNNLNSTERNDVVIRACKIYDNIGNNSIYSTTKNTVVAQYNWWGSNNGNITANNNVDATSPMILMFTQWEKVWDNNKSMDFDINIAMCNKTSTTECGIFDSIYYLPSQNFTVITYYANETKIQTYEVDKIKKITIPEHVIKVTLKFDNEELTYQPGDPIQSYIRLTAQQNATNKTQYIITAEIIDGRSQKITEGKFIFKINGVSQGNAIYISKGDLNLTVNNTGNYSHTYLITFVYGGTSHYTECRQNMTITIEGAKSANTKSQESTYWNDTNNTIYVTERAEC
ncbi:hypothetical protein [Methanosphaera cuniculi]|uniref:hypothetical protein n=1 Tax=Methanosphaera cuniculi TaxID=1077256 RepID=UPI0026E9331B|nr:hypothetical protein [Methanosphaera cuniculi]